MIASFLYVLLVLGLMLFFKLPVVVLRAGVAMAILLLVTSIMLLAIDVRTQIGWRNRYTEFFNKYKTKIITKIHNNKNKMRKTRSIVYKVVDFLLHKLIPIGLGLSIWAILSIEVQLIPMISCNLSPTIIVGWNRVFLALSYSYIAGLIVYWLTVKLPFENKKKVVLPVVETRIRGLGVHLSNMNVEFRMNNANPEVSDIEGVVALFTTKRWTGKCIMPEHVKCKNVTDAFFQDYKGLQNKIGQIINDYKNYLTMRQLFLLENLRGGRISGFVLSYEGTTYTDDFYEKFLQPDYIKLLVVYNKLASTLVLREDK